MFEKLRNWVRRPVAYVVGEWNRMAPRERRLIRALGGSLGAAIVLVAGFLVYQTISDIEEHNDAAREALAAIAKHRDEFQEAKAKVMAQEVRIGSEKPQLQADMESAAREANIQIQDSNEFPPEPAGKRYLEHSANAKLRAVDLQSLSKFLAKLETGRRLIVVTNLHVIRRFGGEGDKLDVELTAKGYERVKENAPKKRTTTGPTAAKEKT